MSINHDQTSLMQKHQRGKKKSNLQVNVNTVVTETKPRWRIERLAEIYGFSLQDAEIS